MDGRGGPVLWRTAPEEVLTPDDGEFFEGWRWGNGRLTDECGGHPLEIFHDLLAQKVRAAALSRLITA